MRRFRIQYKQYLKILGSFVIGILVALGIGYAAQIFFNSDEVGYSNQNSTLTANNVQGALDELYNKCGDLENNCPSGTWCDNSFDYKFPDYTKINQICTSSTVVADEPYINTGLKYSNTHTNNNDYFYGFFIEFTIKSFTTAVSGSKDKVILGMGTSDWTHEGFYFDYNFNDANNPYIYLRNNSASYSGSTLPSSQQAAIVDFRYYAYYNYNTGGYPNNKFTLYDKGETYSEVAPYTIDYPAFLFSYNKSGSPDWTAHVCIHKAIFTNNNGIVKKFTPCRNELGKLGMCEEVNAEFYQAPNGKNFSLTG